MSEGIPPCKNFGDDDGKGGVVCMNQSDPRFTMDFTDVELGAFIYWCAECGPEAQAMNDAIAEACATRPGFAQEMSEAIENATRKG